MNNNDIYSKEFIKRVFGKTFEDLEIFWDDTIQNLNNEKKYNNLNTTLFLLMLATACVSRVKDEAKKFSNYEERETANEQLAVLAEIIKGQILEIHNTKPALPPIPKLRIRTDGNVSHLLEETWLNKPLDKQRCMWKLIKSNYELKKIIRKQAILQQGDQVK